MKKFIRTAAAAAAMVAAVNLGSLNVSAEELKDVFDAEYYADTYADVKAAFGNNQRLLLKHYKEYGLAEGRQGSAAFNVVEYRKAYPDLEAVLGNKWDAYVDHYYKYGMKEGRTAGVNGTSASTSSTATSSTTTSSTATSSQPPLTLIWWNEGMTGDEKEYDAAGRIIKECGVYRDTDWGMMVLYVYDYDAAGNQIRRAMYDPEGVLVNWETYEYDAAGKYIDSTWHNNEAYVWQN